MPTLNIAKKYLLKLASDIHSLIIAAVFTSAGIFLFYIKGAWSALLESLEKPAPLWVALVFLLLSLTYTYLKLLAKKEYKVKIEFLESQGYKWKFERVKPDYTRISEKPYCIKHDLELIGADGVYICPNNGAANSCNTLLPYEESSILLSIAKSHIEKHVRNT